MVTQSTNQFRYDRDIKALLQFLPIAKAASLIALLGGLASLGLSLKTWGGRGWSSPDQPFRYMFCGVVFLSLAVTFFFRSVRWRQRLVWVFEHEMPTLMMISIKGQPGSLRAVLSSERAWQERNEHRKVWLFQPRWNAASLVGQEIPARVYFDPKSKKPLVIETEMGLLWKLPWPASQ